MASCDIDHASLPTRRSHYRSEHEPLRSNKSVRDPSGLASLCLVAVFLRCFGNDQPAIPFLSCALTCSYLQPRPSFKASAHTPSFAFPPVSTTCLSLQLSRHPIRRSGLLRHHVHSSYPVTINPPLLLPSITMGSCMSSESDTPEAKRSREVEKTLREVSFLPDL
jgi:hypothetical protein